MKALLVLCAAAAFVCHVNGHGRLEEPPSRASAWRFGFSTPVNYQDNELYCGGFQNQQLHGGKCGVCGDPYQGPREHEAGGKYATGTIVRSYNQGGKMPVRVHITANHKGWMEFRLCENNDPKKAVTFDCLNRHLLKIAGTTQTRYKVTQSMSMINVDLELPAGVTCKQCVLQWKYHAGNSWNVDPDTSRACVGCGPQEEFYGCADIAIEQGEGHATPPTTGKTVPPMRKTKPSEGKTTSTVSPTRKTSPTMRKTTPTMGKTTPTVGKTTPTVRTTMPTMKTSSPPTWRTTIHPGKWCGQKCCAVGPWKNVSKMDKWCKDNCNRGFCPDTHCLCLS